jgi:heptosyltransferase-3
MAVNRNLKLKGNERVLIVRPDRLGDLVLTLPVALILKRLYPHITVEFLTSRYNDPIIPYAKYIDGSISVDNIDGHKLPLAELVSKLARKHYDIAIFARPELWVAFAAYLANIPVRVGTARRAYSPLFNIRLDLRRRHTEFHEADLNLKLLQPFGIRPAPDTVKPLLKSTNEIAGKQLTGTGSYIVIHPGMKGSAANWPTEYYRQLIGRLSGSMKIVLTGQDRFEVDRSDNIINLINKTDFSTLMRILGGCSLFISGSTGPLHIAAALGRPTIGLYPDHPVLGPHRWGPRGPLVKAIAPPKQTGHKCRINNDGSCDCMKKIDIDTVVQAALDMVKATESKS